MKKRLNINLKPESIAIRKKTFFLNKLKKAVTVEMAILMVILGANFFFFLQNNNLKARLALIDEEWQATEPLLKEKDGLVQLKDGYNEVFRNIKAIFKRDLSWFSTLRAFSRLIPEEMWFKEMALKNVGAKRVLEIKASIGYLENDEQKLNKMNAFIEKAKTNAVLAEYFEIPDLKDITKAKLKEDDILEVKFNFPLKEINDED